MGEWMGADAYVRVPENVPIGRWLESVKDRWHPTEPRLVLAWNDDEDVDDEFSDDGGQSSLLAAMATTSVPDPETPLAAVAHELLTRQDGTEHQPTIDALLGAADEHDFEWTWDAKRRLLRSSDLEVDHGLYELTGLGDTLRDVDWGFHFNTSGKHELHGQCLEWWPGWPTIRFFVFAGERRCLDSSGMLQMAEEARTGGHDPVEYIAAILGDWPGLADPGKAS